MSADLGTSLDASLLGTNDMLVNKSTTKVRIIAKSLPISASFGNAAKGTNLRWSEKYNKDPGEEHTTGPSITCTPFLLNSPAIS